MTTDSSWRIPSAIVARRCVCLLAVCEGKGPLHRNQLQIWFLTKGSGLDVRPTQRGIEQVAKAHYVWYTECDDRSDQPRCWSRDKDPLTDAHKRRTFGQDESGIPDLLGVQYKIDESQSCPDPGSRQKKEEKI